MEGIITVLKADDPRGAYRVTFGVTGLGRAGAKNPHFCKNDEELAIFLDEIGVQQRQSMMSEMKKRGAGSQRANLDADVVDEYFG